MNRRGTLFLDTIIGLFLIGLIVMVLFPIYTLTQKGFTHHKSMTQMSYISESIIESLIVKDEQALEFLDKLEAAKELEYPYLEDNNYISTVRLLRDNSYLWDLSIIVSESKGGEANVQLEATIRK